MHEVTTDSEKHIKSQLDTIISMSIIKSIDNTMYSQKCGRIKSPGNVKMMHLLWIRA